MGVKGTAEQGRAKQKQGCVLSPTLSVATDGSQRGTLAGSRREPCVGNCSDTALGHCGVWVCMVTLSHSCTTSTVLPTIASHPRLVSLSWGEMVLLARDGEQAEGFAAAGK